MRNADLFLNYSHRVCFISSTLHIWREIKSLDINGVHRMRQEDSVLGPVEMAIIGILQKSYWHLEIFTYSFFQQIPQVLLLGATLYHAVEIEQ